MADLPRKDDSALVAVAVCILVVGSGSADYLGPWKYLFSGGAVALCLAVIVRAAQRR